MGNPTDRKSKFQNDSQGVLGVVQFNVEGKPVGVPVPYKGVVFLSEEEQILTANAPRNESDNPFLNGLRLLERGADMDRARPIGEDQAKDDEPAAAEPPAPEEPAAPPAPPEPSALPPGEDSPGEIRQERPPQPAAPPPGNSGSAAAGAEIIEPATGSRQVKSGMRPSSSPAAPAPKAAD
jgi:hypothetical protein